jgi:hypothetical protein
VFIKYVTVGDGEEGHFAVQQCPRVVIFLSDGHGTACRLTNSLLYIVVATQIVSSVSFPVSVHLQITLGK